MSADYPVMLRLAGRRCVVVGGGTVALRRTQRLVACEADILVVAPRARSEIGDMAVEGKLWLELRPFEPAYLDGALIAIAATDDRDVNQAVAQAARARGVLVNVADDPASGDFTVPAIVRRSNITLGISTGGRSPAFTRFLREQLDAWLTEDRSLLLELASEMRRELRATVQQADPSRWQIALTDPGVAAAIRAGDLDAARERIQAVLTVEP